MIIIVNALEASKSVLAQLGMEANTGTPSTLTIPQMGMIIPTVRGVVLEFETVYQDHINNNQSDFSLSLIHI